MKIVLIGYMGSGKSSVGRKLSERLQIPFKDIDSEIEKVERVSISDIFKIKGEIYFRTIENKILKELLSRPESFVLATGGGTPCYSDSMAFMVSSKDVQTIYLKTALENLTTRLFHDKDKRPLLHHLKTEDDLNDFIRKHLFERVYYYSQSDYVIDVKNENIEETVEKLVSLLL